MTIQWDLLLCSNQCRRLYRDAVLFPFCVGALSVLCVVSEKHATTFVNGQVALDPSQDYRAIKHGT